MLCKRCKMVKKSTEFYKTRTYYCKECNREMCRNYKTRNKDKISRYNKKYKLKHKEEISVYNKKYNIENR